MGVVYIPPPEQTIDTRAAMDRVSKNRVCIGGTERRLWCTCVCVKKVSVCVCVCVRERAHPLGRRRFHSSAQSKA